MRNRLPVISIIIPAYNAEKTLKKCIKSVLRQTYKNYELIIVDDGSEDNTVAISDFYAERYSAVQVIHSENQGVSSARNLGMEKAIGDYILFLDADDRLIESALDNMVPYTSEAEWVIGNYVMIEEKRGKRIYNRQFFKENIHVGGQNELFELTESRLFHFVWGRLYDRRILQQYQLCFDKKLAYGEDILFNTHYFVHIKKFVVLQKTVYCYNCHLTTGLSNQVTNEWKLQKKICQEMQNILCSSNDISSKAKNKMNHFYYAQCIASVERMVRKRKKRDTLMILNDSFFQNILQREKSAGRIHNLDYWLLKHKKGYIYCGIHRIYVRIKKLKEIVQ